MELWVRSQDKKELVKVNNVYVIDYNGYYYVASQVNGDEMLLGEYEFQNSKRALEVLDEIQTQIATLNYQYLHRGTNFIVTESNVYEMPKE
jgi:hypothetical protein